MGPDSKLEIPKAKIQTNRSLYLFEGKAVDINGEKVSGKKAIFLKSNEDLVLESKSGNIQLVYLEAKPIGEPVVQYGPFVMTTKQEILQTMEDYQRTEFGGWNWERRDMIHGPKIERFAKYPDGRIERP